MANLNAHVTYSNKTPVLSNSNLNLDKDLSQKNVSKNPFDDNDLFGLEFDRIRHKNEQMLTSPNVNVNTASGNKIVLNKQQGNANPNFNCHSMSNYQSYKTHVKSNSCSNIKPNNLINLNDPKYNLIDLNPSNHSNAVFNLNMSASNSNSNLSQDSQIFITHL